MTRQAIGAIYNFKKTKTQLEQACKRNLQGTNRKIHSL